MEAKKITLLVIAIVAAIVCLGFMGIRAFTTKVMNSRDCEWANIDNIEMRIKVDVPATLDCNCNYVEATDTKTSTFTLDTEDLDFAGYAKKNSFVKMKPGEKVPEGFFANNEFGNTESLYYREGATKWEKYKMVLDPKNGKLWVYLKYLQ